MNGVDPAAARDAIQASDEAVMHPICRQRQLRLRVVAVCVVLDVVAANVAYATSRPVLAWICGGFAVFAFATMLRFRRLLINGCPAAADDLDPFLAQLGTPHDTTTTQTNGRKQDMPRYEQEPAETAAARHWDSGDRERAILVLHNTGWPLADLIGFCRERGLDEDAARRVIRDAPIDWS